MKYLINYQNSHKHFVDIELLIQNITTNSLSIQLPAWRPGRYELQNFGKNIQHFMITDENNHPLPFEKTSKEQWFIATKGINQIKIKYNCYAHQMDAGGCWLDEEQLYLNFIYCLVYVIGREYEPCEVTLQIPPNYQIACGLPQKNSVLYASDYYHLVDSPMIASASLQKQSYNIKENIFNIWIQGNLLPEWKQVLNDFKKFTEEQIKMMGDFPENDYHFLFQILPYKHHHGVEHRNSTVITLGPAELMNNTNNYFELLSISSHELFHSWNIVKIRPSEMMPYDFTKENYFKSGFIAEGITTYYGDYFLARTGLFNQEKYFEILNYTFEKHFENFANTNLSIADSSFDLWIDGYSQGIPNRKVSIYVKGCIIALLLDLEVRSATENKNSLDDIMKYLWEHFGKKGIGYSLNDFQIISEKIANISLKDFFEECIYGKTTMEGRLVRSLNYIGCTLAIIDSKIPTECLFGFKTIVKEGKIFISNIEPDSPSDIVLSQDDEIIAIDSLKVSNNINEQIGHKEKISISFFRNNKLLSASLLSTGKKTYFKQYKIAKKHDATQDEKNNFSKWLNHSF